MSAVLEENREELPARPELVMLKHLGHRHVLAASGLWGRKLALVRQAGPYLLAKWHRQWWAQDPREGQDSTFVADKQRQRNK